MRTARVVVITGASAGVGRAVVRALASEGAHIGLVGRGRAGLEGARHDTNALGGKAIVLPTDVADPDQVERAAAAVEHEFGPIDVWVNDAFSAVFSPVNEMTAADYRRATEVSYLGFVHGTLAALGRMRPRDRGVIVQVGSALAYRAIPLQSAYCAAKHAVRGFTDSVRTELLHDKSRVRITMVHLPALNTPQFSWTKSRMPRKAQPVPPIYQPEVAAEAVAWATRHYRREWYVGGSTALVIAGNKLAPGLGDHYLARTGYESQMHDGPEDPRRPNNFDEPVDDDQDYGAHGDFDDRAHRHSVQLWLDQRRAGIVLAALGGALADAMGGRSPWRGGLAGLVLGALGALACGVLAARSFARQARLESAIPWCQPESELAPVPLAPSR